MSIVWIIFSFLVVPSMGSYYGSISIAGHLQEGMEGIGQAHLVGNNFTKAYVTVNEDGSFVVKGGGGKIYFANQESNLLTPEIYWKAPLMNKRLSFVVDVSGVGCHCNAQAYLVQMPASNAGPANDYYCDASQNNGNYCPQYYIFQGNKYNMNSKLRVCSGEAGAWTSCGGARGQNAYDVDDKLMCPDATCLINTNNPFKVTYFQNESVVTVELEQEGRKKEYTICQDEGWTKAMPFNDMVLVVSVWGSQTNNMVWLDGKTGCTGACYMTNTTVKFSDFKLI